MLTLSKLRTYLGNRVLRTIKSKDLTMVLSIVTSPGFSLSCLDCKRNFVTDVRGISRRLGGQSKISTTWTSRPCKSSPVIVLVGRCDRSYPCPGSND